MTLNSALSGLVATLVALVLFYAALVEPAWLEVTHVRLASSDRQPLVIAQLSDLHLSTPGALESSIFETLHNQPPDLILLSGDVVDSEEGLEQLPGLLARFPSVPTFAVLGNWEYWSAIDLTRLRALYERAGVVLLVNETRRLVLKGKRLRIVGLDDDTGGKPSPLEGAADHIDELRILMQHSPGYFESVGENPGARFDLCVSGHTHGGQFTLFGIPLLLPPGSGGFVHGLYDHVMCPIYVSRGLGTSVLPLRFWARPELAYFEF